MGKIDVLCQSGVVNPLYDAADRTTRRTSGSSRSVAQESEEEVWACEMKWREASDSKPSGVFTEIILCSVFS